jgi:hypothetical protein
MAINRHGLELGVFVGLANLVIFNHFMPPVTDVKSAPQFEQMCETSEREALLATTALTLLVAGFARSMDTFIVAGAVIIGVDFAFKHAIAVHPDTGKMSSPGDQQDNSGGNLHPLPDYSMTGS